MQTPRTRSLFPLVIFTMTLTVACGGGSSTPTSPTPAATTPPVTTTPPAASPAPATPQPPSNFGVFTFSFDAGTSVADQELIGGAVQAANDYFTAAFGRTLTTATQIRGVLSAAGCQQGGSAAFTGPGSVTFCLSNPGWMQPGSVLKRKIVVHEIYHVLQFERRWLGNVQTAGPDWIIEGAAELVGYKGIESRGLLPYSIAQGCQIKEFTDFGRNNPPGLPNLSAIESRQAWQTTQGPLYALAMTGMDQLITARGLSALNTYMDAIAGGASYQTAFQSAFGQTITAFYDQFPAYRAGLTVPPAYLCGV
jgi:hypothetical protein